MKIHENPILVRFSSYLGKNFRKFGIFKSEKKIQTKIIFETYDAIWTVWTLAFDCTTIYEQIITFEKNWDFFKKSFEKRVHDRKKKGSR